MTPHPVRRRSGFVALVLIALLGAGCSDNSSGGTQTAASAEVAPPEPSVAATTPSTEATETTAQPSSPTTQTAAGEGAVDVAIRLVAFTPELVQVAPGGTVRWTQNDAGAHTVTSGVVAEVPGGVEATPDGTFASERLAKGETFEFTGSAPGRISYFCEIHPATMRGVVEVR